MDEKVFRDSGINHVTEIFPLEFFLFRFNIHIILILKETVGGVFFFF